MEEQKKIKFTFTDFMIYGGLGVILACFFLIFNFSWKYFLGVIILIIVVVWRIENIKRIRRERRAKEEGYRT